MIFRENNFVSVTIGEEYSSNATTGVLQISRLAVTTIFGCRGHNDAGNGPLVESHVGVKPIGKTKPLDDDKLLYGNFLRKFIGKLYRRRKRRPNHLLNAHRSVMLSKDIKLTTLSVDSVSFSNLRNEAL